MFLMRKEATVEAAPAPSPPSPRITPDKHAKDIDLEQEGRELKALKREASRKGAEPDLRQEYSDRVKAYKQEKQRRRKSSGTLFSSPTSILKRRRSRSKSESELSEPDSEFSAPEPPTEQVALLLEEGKLGLGLGVLNGRVVVRNVRPSGQTFGGAAAGDVINIVDGIEIMPGVTVEKVVRLLCQAARPFAVELQRATETAATAEQQRTPPSSPRAPPPAVASYSVSIASEMIGMAIGGHGPHFVRSVQEGGGAQEAGVRVGSELLMVGEQAVSALLHDEAVDVLRKQSRPVILTLRTPSRQNPDIWQQRVHSRRQSM